MTNKTKSIESILSEMQKSLKAPKNQYNSFGKYKYRSCEDILEGVKSVMPEGCNLILSDNIVEVAGRVYVKSTAMLNSEEGFVSASAYAREAVSKKGMDDAQVTGSASSYARKYALNGLFCIDDTKDADTDESKKQEKKEPPKKELSKEQALYVKILEQIKGSDVNTIDGVWEVHQGNLDKLPEKGQKALLAEYEKKKDSLIGNPV